MDIAFPAGIAYLEYTNRKWFQEPILRDVIVVTGAWCVYNLYLALVSLGAFWERKQVRRFHRINASGPITVHFPRMKAAVEGQVIDVSLSGIGFEINTDFPIKPQERVTLEVKDSYGKVYRFESCLQRIVKKQDKYFCGGEFVTNLVAYPNIVSFVFGDSLRWRQNWEMKSRSRGTWRMLLYFLRMGIKGVKDCAWELFKQAMVALWRLLVKWFSTGFLRDVVVAAGGWIVYKFYLGLMWLVETIEHKQARKFRRMQASGSAVIDFPLHNAHVFGKVSDVSLTGVGVVVDVPFKLEEREPVVIDVKDEEGHEYHLDCTIKRAIERDGHLLCGAEFVIDMHSFPEIVHYVYGESLTDIAMHAVKGHAH